MSAKCTDKIKILGGEGGDENRVAVRRRRGEEAGGPLLGPGGERKQKPSRLFLSLSRSGGTRLNVAHKRVVKLTAGLFFKIY